MNSEGTRNLKQRARELEHLIVRLYSSLPKNERRGSGRFRTEFSEEDCEKLRMGFEVTGKRHRGDAYKTLAQAASNGTFYRRTADEWSNLFGISRQRFHQIRDLLRFPTRRAMVPKVLTARLSWKARAQALWRLGIFDRRGDCWESSVVHFDAPVPGVQGRKCKVLYRLRYGNMKFRGCFGLPTCGHRWCINPEHQKPVGLGVLAHLRALPRLERVAAALEAGLSQLEISRREGITSNYVSQINCGVRVRGVRDKYPIRPRQRGKRKDEG